MKARRSIVWGALLLLTACVVSPLPAPSPAVPSVTPAPTAAAAGAVQPPAAPSLNASALPAPLPTTLPPVRRVLIISVDGLRPDAIAAAPMPTVQSLMADGAFTLDAQTIFPSATLPSHASMLLGVCPDQHGVDWNDYLPERGYARGDSLFALAQRVGLRTVMVAGKEKLSQLSPPETLEAFLYVNDFDAVVAERAAGLLKEGFGVALVHFPVTDGVGHELGWMSAGQLSVVRRADAAIASLLDVLEGSGLRQDTLIIITADHGGHDSSHGSDLPEDMTIPWIIAGPGVVPQQLSAPVHITDTFATAAWALHLYHPVEIAGQPVLEAFGLPAPARREPRCP